MLLAWTAVMYVYKYHIRQNFHWLKFSPKAHTMYWDKNFNFANRAGYLPGSCGWSSRIAMHICACTQDRVNVSNFSLYKKIRGKKFCQTACIGEIGKIFHIYGITIVQLYVLVGIDTEEHPIYSTSANPSNIILNSGYTLASYYWKIKHCTRWGVEPNHENVTTSLLPTVICQPYICHLLEVTEQSYNVHLYSHDTSPFRESWAMTMKVIGIQPAAIPRDAIRT